MKRLLFFLLLCCLLITACATRLPEEHNVQNPDLVTIGNSLEIRDTDERLTLQDNKDALSAEGLYYATWVAEDCEEYVNSEGSSVDLYDAQLYLLLGEARTGEKANENLQIWLAAANANYEVQSTEELQCGGQSYTVITYLCKNADNPYERGVSAFGAHGSSAICVEFTCKANYKEDIKTILTDFLNNCKFTEAE